MERKNLSKQLQETAEARKRSLQSEAEIEQRRQADKKANEYRQLHEQEFIDELAMNAEAEVLLGRTTARISKREDAENREGLYQTMRAVRDYYKAEGFKTGFDTGTDTTVIYDDDGNPEWIDATTCWAQLTIAWPDRPPENVVA